MRIELPFLAAVPLGHEVVVQYLERPGFLSGWVDADAMVLDRVTGIVWTPWIDTMALTAENFHVQHLGSNLRRKQGGPALSGRVVGCHVSTKGIGEHNHIATALTLAPLEASAYR
ncbi:hypothetical protein AKJ09_05659 [Labilithrix luteola]|uniref:Uncharacterized protein n=1 Tax=Labilithrix luteola TaxID=1391654 RepID=A0A0K1PZN2_9BACT|nr:hypothetical protein [Labilithrix luteola]AKU98995.1 hypothetical protein AKJ09_05659 [Labilithrix luteola]